MLPLLEALAPVLKAAAPLLKKRDTWYLLAIAVLALLLGRLRGQKAADDIALAQRAQVQEQAKSTEDKRVDKGAVSIVKKYLPNPNCAGAPVLAEVDMNRAPTTITDHKVSEERREERPACPAAAPEPWREASVLVDPLATSKVVGVDGSVTVFHRLVLGLGGRTDRGLEGHARVGVRF